MANVPKIVVDVDQFVQTKTYIMSIRNAKLLLRAIDTDEALRTEIYRCSSRDKLLGYLNSTGYSFDMDEFEDAVSNLHTQCQSYEEAEALFDRADWLRFQMMQIGEV